MSKSSEPVTTPKPDSREQSLTNNEVQLKVELLRELVKIRDYDRNAYTQKLQEAAAKLGKSARTVRRWLDKWEREGLEGVLQTRRADKGKCRIAKQWQEFILKEYREGNQGVQRMNIKQVVAKVKARANSLGIQAPSRSTIYRFLQPYIEEQEEWRKLEEQDLQLCNVNLTLLIGSDQIRLVKGEAETNRSKLIFMNDINV